MWSHFMPRLSLRTKCVRSLVTHEVSSLGGKGYQSLRNSGVLDYRFDWLIIASHSRWSVKIMERINRACFRRICPSGSRKMQIFVAPFVSRYQKSLSGNSSCSPPCITLSSKLATMSLSLIYDSTLMESPPGDDLTLVYPHLYWRSWQLARGFFVPS